MSETKLVIFDCDGVLVDSEIIAIRIETELLRSAGYEISDATLAERFSGMSWREILMIIEHESGLKLMDALLDRTEAILDDRLPKEVEIIQGVRDALSAISLPKCVCSNTKMSRLLDVIEKVGLRDVFAPNIFSAKDLGEGRSKPKPDIFLHGAAVMGVDPSETIVVEDSVHGVQGAHTAGMRVIGFTGGAHTYADHSRNLLHAGAVMNISHMRDLPAAIARLSTGDRT